MSKEQISEGQNKKNQNKSDAQQQTHSQGQDQNQARTWYAKAWNGLGIGIPGVWLACLYLFFGFFVVFSLSAHQLQFRINSLNTEEGNENATVWELDQLHTEWNRLKLDINSQSSELANLRSEKLALASKKNSDLVNYDQDRIACLSSLAEINVRLKDDFDNYKAKEEIRCDQSSYDWIKIGISRLMPASESEPNLTSKLELLEKQQTVVPMLEERFKEIQLASNRLEEIDESIFIIENNLIESRANIKQLVKSSTLGKQAGDYLNALSYLNGKESMPFMPAFSEMPTDLLTVILVMSMGALGGTISLTRSYLSQKKTSGHDRIGGAYYTFRPFLGAITALSVFILAKAGVLVISTPAQGVGGAALSPFFISFLGIISGMLAEAALDTIQRTGNNWFRNSNSMQYRWGYGLKQSLSGDESYEKEEREAMLYSNITQLSEMLEVSIPTIKKWVDEIEQVPPAAQAIIAAFVRKPIREVFSDMGQERNLSDLTSNKDI